ncbi:DNA-dependent protein kinase catalytic subunit-like [Macrosteles quadrilineatus]|uniref:DNA-dependent protein kinase catalytic subunit-like n=1 Tax=Macrosteles quadrilineatus TaxID=74068 RepID=UPI0023E1715D|nr:DNA-dependent protein kinase catalytic subunit-like [Macrosteles quadrilineatus]
MARNLIVENLVAQLISLLNDNSLFRDKRSQNILDQIKSFFSSEHTKPELDFVLSVLFKPDDGLLHFIKEGCCEKTLKPGIKESLLLIIDLFKKYTQDLGLVKYFVQTKDTCYYVVLRYNICGADVLKCAFEVIKEIITSKEALKVKEDLKIPELIGFLYCRCLTDKSIKATALQEVYELFGAIASTFPECFGDSQIKSFVRKVLDELKLQLKQTNNVKPCIIEGCMNALKGVFSNFPRAYDDPDKELAEQSKTIYLYIKDAFQGDSTRKAYQRATLDLFATHIELLWGWVVEFKDVNYWLPLLSLWAGKISAEDKQIGIKAVRALHEKAMSHITSHPDDAMKHDFLSYYKRVLECHRAASYNMDLAIEGISTLAGISSNEINQTDVTNIFRLILQRAQTDFPLQDSTTAERSDSDERLAKYLESLSNVCSKLSSVTNDQLSGMTRLWRLLVERYPHHYARTQIIMVESLSVTMLRMGMCDPSVFARFLYPVVYQSILVTCCHTLVEEAELQEELTQREVITYKNYKKLWEGLFRVGYETKNKRKVQGVTPQLRRMVLDSLYDCFVKSLVEIIGKLNVKLCDKDETNEEVKTDPESNLKSENPQDHNVLCNLANLYKDLLAVLDSERLFKWLSELLSTVINQSVRSPLVSAFYKLLAALLSVAQRTNYFLDESEEVQSLGQYIVRYLEDVMLQCQQYKNDLQASCLLALVSVPVPLIKPLLAGIAPVMQMIFRLGQSLLSLAVQGMNALELWQRSLPPDELKPILHQVLPWFDPYLRSRGITTELPEDENLQMSKRQQKRERRIKEATRLAELQKRMLRLLGQLDSATCLTLLSHPTDITTWSDEPMVNFKMPFPDQRFSVPMDSLLPRVVELAMTSSDRQTKAAACEVLHAFVLLFIGNGTTVIETKQPELESILSRLMPSLLRLSCGSDLVAMQLFRPLTLQLMRWFCFPKMLHCKKPVQTQAVLQAVWDGITDEEDVALQDFSALCLKEFVHWSIKQSPDQLLVDRPLGPKAITRIINSYCLHPSLTKRRGAALAFSHIAGELRKPPLLDVFWLELMYHLVLNLELGGASHNHPATAALTVIGKVMKKKADLFNEKSDARRVPDALGSGSLLDVVKFLAQKCGSQTVICATKCRELILELMPLVPDIPPLDQLVDIVRVCEGAGSGLMLPIQPGVSDADHLRASIDCYAWCIKKSFIPPFVAIQSPSRLVPCVEYFVNMLDLTVVPTLLCSRQDTVLMKAKCGVVVALFDLLALLYSQIKKLPYTFFQRNFWKLLAMCIFSSQNVGLDWRNKELAEHLSDKIRLLLCTLRDQMKPADLENMYEALSSQVLYDCTTCVERLSLMCQGLQPLELKDKQYVDGLITLYKTDLLQHLKFGRTWYGNTLLRGVFNSLFDSDELPLHPESSVKGFQQKLLHLAFLLGAEVSSIKSDYQHSVFRDSAAVTLKRCRRRGGEKPRPADSGQFLRQSASSVRFAHTNQPSLGRASEPNNKQIGATLTSTKIQKWEASDEDCQRDPGLLELSEQIGGKFTIGALPDINTSQSGASEQGH